MSGKRPARKWLRGFAAGAGALVVALSAVSLASVIRDDKSRDPSVVRLGASASLPPVIGITDLGAAPVPTFSDVVVWTGSVLLTYGGSVAPGNEVNAGATYEPASGEWTAWPGAPLDAPLFAPVGVWTGSELVIVGVSCQNVSTSEDDDLRCSPGTLAAVAFDPEKETWRSLPAPPDRNSRFVDGTGASFGTPVAWLNDRAVFLSIDNDLLAYAPEADAWETLPHQVGQVCGVGTTLVSWRTEDSDEDFASPVSLRVLRHGQEAWTGVPAPPGSQDVLGWQAYCADDNHVYVADQRLENLWRLNLESTEWTDLGGGPRDVVTEPVPVGAVVSPDFQMPVFFQSSAWTGRGLIFWNADRPAGHAGADGRVPAVPGFAVSFDPATQEWSHAAPGPYLDLHGSDYAWAGGFAFIVGFGETGPTLSIYRPK